jgi:uracil-DNA glycosylase
MSDSTAIPLRRALRQQLESLRRAGVTSLPRSRSEVPLLEFAVPAPSEAGSPAHPPRQRTAGGPAPTHAATSPARSLFAESQVPLPTAAATNAEITRSTLSREERQQKLTVLAKAVSGCQRCPELCSTRTQTVFGVGSSDARVLFIGEAPGADEDKQGEPFVGKAGQLLNKIIEACKLTRQEIYICNILKCRPPGNRLPAPAEAANCREYLQGQLAAVDPDYIVCWGSCAAQNLLETNQAIGKLRGRFYQHGRAKVLCTYHPSYLLRNPAAKKDVWEDMKLWRRDMGVELA